jgi:EmrB/QacA subfamily drug resistance transporter
MTDVRSVRSPPIPGSTSRWVLIAAVLGTALAYMSDDMLNLAVPSVARELGATVTDVQWILNAYYVSLVSLVLVAGSVGDVVGHRRVFIGGIVTFSAGAVLCALAPEVWVMVIGRFVQGAGAAMLLASGLALVTRLSALEDRNRAIGRFFGLVAAVPALGPFLSGALVDFLSWRWLFVVPLVLPVMALAITWRLVPETPVAGKRRPDLAGAALVFVTLSSVSIALIMGAARPLAPVPLAAVAVALAGATALMVVEKRAPDPLLPLRLFRRRVFVGSNLGWLLACLTSWGGVFFLAVLLQNTLGWRPLMAGLILTPIYLVMMVGSPLAAKLADRTGPRPPILAGLGIYAVGLFLLGRLGPTAELVPEVGSALLLFAVGMAIFTAPLAAVVMGSVDESDQGVASGMNNAMGQLAGLLAIAMLPSVAGLAGVGFDSPQFAAGYARALGVSCAIAVVCFLMMVWTLPRRIVGPSPD